MSTSTLSVVASHHNDSTPKAISLASSSTASLIKSSNADDEDDTVTGRRLTVKLARKDHDDPGSDFGSDLRLLAVSAQITEISYSISDIQTRIFEIQELRHRSLDQDKPGNGSTGVIDQALINLDERLEAVSASISAIDETLGIIPGQDDDKAKPSDSGAAPDPLILRKHATLIEEWEAVQNEAETLRDELKEDKWLAVFRTVSEQAEGMMSSLEKGVTQCHDFIWQAQRRYTEDHQSTVSSGTSLLSDRSPINYETFTALLQSFESKKKYYMPSITKVLSVLDKGVRDRVTKNGECLRRHADLRARWHNLRERIGRIDQEMESVRRMLVNRDLEPSEAGSTTSRVTSKSRNGFLSSAVNSRSPSTSRNASSSRTTSTATLNRSISPFSNIKKFATKVSDKISGRQTPSALLTPPSSSGSVRLPPAEPSPAARKSAFFPFRSSAMPPETPPKAKHGHSNSLQSSPASVPPSSAQRPPSSAGKTVAKERWNSSTKIDDEPAGTIKPPPIRKRPSTNNMRSPSPASAAFPSISRPITPSASSAYRPPNASTRTTPSRPASRTGTSSHAKSLSTSSPPRSHTPSIPQRAHTPGGTLIARVQTPGGTLVAPAPRPRPQSPSNIPAPRTRGSSSDGSASSDEYERAPTSLMQRALSPTFSASASAASAVSSSGRPRTPSNSRIPAPTSGLRVPGSRPSSALGRSTSSLIRSQTPEHILRARAQQMPFYQGASGPTPRPSFSSSTGPGVGPPSSFKDSSSTPERPASRSTMFTPSLDQNPSPTYIPVKTDPLDVEVAKCVNGFPHGFLVERIDPPLRSAPRPGEEVRAQYAVSNALARKVVTCRLVVIGRLKSGTSADSADARKVMCRVGGGWLDLQMYLLNRQAGVS